MLPSSPLRFELITEYEHTLNEYICQCGTTEATKLMSHELTCQSFEKEPTETTTTTILRPSLNYTP